MTPSADDISAFFLALEGPYKWYVLGTFLVVLTAVMTRVIFKTFKWFLLLAAVLVIGVTLIYYFAPRLLPIGEGTGNKIEKLEP